MCNFDIRDLVGKVLFSPLESRKPKVPECCEVTQEEKFGKQYSSIGGSEDAGVLGALKSSLASRHYMDYIFMGNALCLILRMQYMDLTMSLLGRVVLPLVFAPLGCLMQGTANTVLLS